LNVCSVLSPTTGNRRRRPGAYFLWGGKAREMCQ
jgi:hypothetical protein